MKLPIATKNADSTLVIIFTTQCPVFEFTAPMSFFLIAQLSVLASIHWPHVLESPYQPRVLGFEWVTLYCQSLTPNSPMSFVLSPCLTGLHGHSFSCGLRAKIDKGDLLDNLTLVKDPEDNSADHSQNTETHAHTHLIYIYIYIKMNSHYCATLFPKQECWTYPTKDIKGEASNSNQSHLQRILYLD